jgi:hypothetical protein
MREQGAEFMERLRAGEVHLDRGGVDGSRAVQRGRIGVEDEGEVSDVEGRAADGRSAGGDQRVDVDRGERRLGLGVRRAARLTRRIECGGAEQASRLEGLQPRPRRRLRPESAAMLVAGARRSTPPGRRERGCAAHLRDP